MSDDLMLGSEMPFEDLVSVDTGDIDLLDVLRSVDDTKEAPEHGEVSSEIVVVEDNEQKVTAIESRSDLPITKEDLTEFFGLGGMYDTFLNEGSGDIFQDLVNWTTDSDKIPSEPLASFLTNTKTKMKFALYFYMLRNSSRLKVISDFITAAETELFSPERLIDLSSNEVLERYELANKTVETILRSDRQTAATISKLDSDEKGSKVDMVSLLLGSLPSHKLKDLIQKLK